MALALPCAVQGLFVLVSLIRFAVQYHRSEKGSSADPVDLCCWRVSVFPKGFSVAPFPSCSAWEWGCMIHTGASDHTWLLLCTGPAIRHA